MIPWLALQLQQFYCTGVTVSLEARFGVAMPEISWES